MLDLPVLILLIFPSCEHGCNSHATHDSGVATGFEKYEPFGLPKMEGVA